MGPCGSLLYPSYPVNGRNNSHLLRPCWAPQMRGLAGNRAQQGNNFVPWYIPRNSVMLWPLPAPPGCRSLGRDNSGLSRLTPGRLDPTAAAPR